MRENISLNNVASDIFQDVIVAGTKLVSQNAIYSSATANGFQIFFGDQKNKSAPSPFSLRREKEEKTSVISGHKGLKS